MRRIAAVFAGGVLAIAAMPQAWAQHGGHATPPPEPHADHAPSVAPTVSSPEPPAESTDLPADAVPREPLLTITDADRAAAFPDVHHGHHAHGTSIHSYWLIDRLEVPADDPGAGAAWEGTAWIGGDIRKLWLRSEGARGPHGLEHADVEILYGRGISAWWDVVAGVRRDFGHGPHRTWLAAGVQGLAPGKFEVSATAYLGDGGHGAFVAEAEYDTLLTNRLILQWRAEASARSQDDPAAGIGRGLSNMHAGLRLRYEFTRRFAPYIGIEHERSFGRTADLRRAAGESRSDQHWVVGVRMWF